MTNLDKLPKTPNRLQKLNEHLSAKIEDCVDEISLVKTDIQENAETLIISYGIVARSVDNAVRKIRESGGKVSTLTIFSLFPIPERAIRSALKTAKRVIVPELNFGQYRREIERLAKNEQEVIGINRLDGNLISPTDIMEAGGWL